jgi:hypothetical protein
LHNFTKCLNCSKCDFIIHNNTILEKKNVDLKHLWEHPCVKIDSVFPSGSSDSVPHWWALNPVLGEHSDLRPAWATYWDSVSKKSSLCFFIIYIYQDLSNIYIVINDRKGRTWSFSGKEKMAQILIKRGGDAGTQTIANFWGATWKVSDTSHKAKADTDLNRQ